jgi:hypothetical protein
VPVLRVLKDPQEILAHREPKEVKVSKELKEG